MSGAAGGVTINKEDLKATIRDYRENVLKPLNLDKSYNITGIRRRPEKNVFGDNKYALVCSEGVGWEQDTYGCLEVPTNIGQMGLWNGRVFISVDTVKSCLTDKTEDISDYIRVFGSRLDSNCSLWQSKMSVAPATIAQ